MLRALLSAGVAAVVAANQQARAEVDVEEACALQVQKASSHEEMGPLPTPAPPAPCKPVSAASGVNLTEFISKPWFAQEQMPTLYSPENELYCVAAEYKQRAEPTRNGYTIDVLNTAQTEDGEKNQAKLCAFQTDPNDSAKLAVAPCFLPKVAAGPYWILLYKEVAGLAIISVGQPDIPTEDGMCMSRGLWIFTRDPNPENKQSLVDFARKYIAEQGFDVSVLLPVSQTNCDYDGVDLAGEWQGVTE